MAAPPGARLRVCYFNRSYWPDTGATGQLLTELAEDLVGAHGVEVTVVTGYPIRHAGPPVPRTEVRNGVRIIRAAGTTLPAGRFVGRATNYATYFLSALWTAIRLPRQDITLAMTDPPIIGLAALAARPRCGMVFVCQDIFPEVAGLLEDFHSPLVNAALERLTRFLVRRAVRIVALGDTMASRLVQGKGADRAKITVIPNWADTSAIVPSDKKNAFSVTHGLIDRFVVLHAGNIGLAQNLDVVIEAADQLRNRPDILVLFIGDGNRRGAREQAAVSITPPRFWARPMLPACRTTKRSARPCARENALSLLAGTIAEVSAQLWMTVMRDGSAPLPSTSRLAIVSPRATIRVARATRKRLRRSSTALTVGLWKSSSRPATSGKISWQKNTMPHRGRAARAARPMIGGSVIATVTSCLGMNNAVQKADAKYVR